MELMAVLAPNQDVLAGSAGYYVVFHKQKTSARTRFLVQGQDAVFPSGLAEDRTFTQGEDPDAPPRPVVPHPAAGLAALGRLLDVPPSSLRVEAAHLGLVVEEDGTPVWLAEVLTTDPPADNAMKMGGRFLSIMEGRHLPANQRELLRRAYERVLG